VADAPADDNYRNTTPPEILQLGEFGGLRTLLMVPLLRAGVFLRRPDHWPIAAVPTCVGPGRPPRYETTYCTDYMIRYQARTYNVFDDQTTDAAK
jgi:hypothetical protein